MASSTKRNRARRAPARASAPGAAHRHHRGAEPTPPPEGSTGRDRALGWVLAATAFGSVTAYGEWGDDPWMPPKLVVLAVGVLVAWVLTTVDVVAGRRRLPRPQLGVPLLVLVGALALGTVLSLTPGASFLGWLQRGAGLLTYLLAASLAYLIVVAAADQPEALERILGGVALGGVVNAVVVLATLAGIGPATETDTPHVGLVGNSNFVAGVLAVCLAAGAVRALRAGDQRERSAWCVGLVLMVAALVVAGSVGGALAAAGAVTTYLAVARTPVPRIVVRLAVVAVLGAVGLLLVAALARSAAWAEPLRSLPVIGSERIGGRVDLWRTAGAIAAERPLVGTGPETFLLGYGRHVPTPPLGFPETADAPHNVAFQHLVAGGLPAMLAFLAVVGWAGRMVARRTAAGAEPDGPVDAADPDRHLLAGFAAMGAAYVLQALVSIDVVPLIVLGAVALGGVATLADPALVRRRSAGPSDAATGAAPPAILLSAGATLGSAVLVWFAVTGQLANIELRRGLDALEQAKAGSAPPTAVLGHFADGMAISPLDTELVLRAGTSGAALANLPSSRVDDITRAGLLRDARRHLDEAMARQPGYPEATLTLADLLGLQARRDGDPTLFADADALFARVQADDPRNPVGYLDHGAVLLDWWRLTGDPSRRELALVRLAEAEARSFRWPKGLTNIAANYEAAGERQRALAALDRALAWEPGYAPALELRARLTGTG